MKRVALFSLAFAALSLASCEKSRTCTCSSTATDVTSGGGSSNTTTSTDSYVVTLPKASKKVAKGTMECMSRTEKTSNSYVTGGVTYTDDITTEFTCTIK